MAVISSRTKGFSLAEALMATVVLSMAAAGVLLPFASGASVRAEGVRRTLSARLASDLIEEIITTPFDNIVSTYDGYTEAKGQVKDLQGIVFSDSSYANFSRDAACTYVYVPQETGDMPAEYITVTVHVYYNGQELAQITRLVTK
ncbi:MAG: hypothetical protein JXB29_10980 [Sedimentisphaerales bacterium]|nr:hypothetical protein [Sedimentisphaerales bacterium]